MSTLDNTHEDSREDSQPTLSISSSATFESTSMKEEAAPKAKGSLRSKLSQTFSHRTQSGKSWGGCTNNPTWNKVKYMTPWGMARYTNRVSNDFGFKFTLMIISAYIGVKGTLHGFIVRVMLPYYKSMNLSGIQYQTASAVASAPWAMKGLIGALSDGQPLFGYAKRPYMMITSVMGIAGVIGLALIPLEIALQYQWIPAVLFMASQLQVSTIDLLCEGKYAELMAKMPHTGTDIVTFVWMCIMTGKLVSAALVGPLADGVGTSIIFWLSVPMAVQVMLPVVLGYLPEVRLPVGERFTPRWSKIVKQRKLFAISTLMAFGAIGLVIVSLMGPPLLQFAYSISISIVLATLSFAWMPREMAMCNLYMFLTDIFHPTLSGALEYWYTADQTCVPGGPSFSYTYYTTWSGLVGLGASLVGVSIFQTIMRDWTFRKAFWVTTGIRVLASVFDLMIVARWNIAIGISDKVVFMLGDAIILDIVEMMNFMPSVVLISKLCPKDMESTVYAILAGFSNFGATVSKSIGVYAIQLSGIDTTTCSFESLPYLLLICHFALPLLTVPLTFCMIPNVKMTGDLIIGNRDDDDDEDGNGELFDKEEKEGKEMDEKDNVNVVVVPSGSCSGSTLCIEDDIVDKYEETVDDTENLRLVTTVEDEVMKEEKQ